MLILKRREGSSITIGSAIKITVVEIDSQGARLGIDAPASIPVLRDDAVTVRQRQDGGVIDAHVTQLAAIVANVEAPQFDRVRALSQLVEHCTICGHAALQKGGA